MTLVRFRDTSLSSFTEIPIGVGRLAVIWRGDRFGWGEKFCKDINLFEENMAGANFEFLVVCNEKCSWKDFSFTKTMQVFGIKSLKCFFMQK